MKVMDFLAAKRAEAVLLVYAMLHGRGFRTNEAGDIDVGAWVGIFVSVVILVLIVAALFPVLIDALASYAGNETVFGPILVIVVPLVIGAAILLGVVTVFLARAKGM